jgi:hypothetical protein
VNDWISMSGSEIGIRPRPIFKIKTRWSTFVTIESPRDRSGRGKDPASERLKPELGRWSGRRDSKPLFRFLVVSQRFALKPRFHWVFLLF